MSVKVTLIHNIFENQAISNTHDAGKLKVLLQEFCLLHKQDLPNLAYTKVTVDIKLPEKDWEPVVPNVWNDLIVPDDSEIRIVPSIGDQKASGVISVVIGFVMIAAGNNQNKASLIGRNKRRFLELKKIIQDTYRLDLKII